MSGRSVLAVSLFVSVSILSCGIVQAQSAEQIEEQRATGFVQAVKAGDADALLRYMSANWVPADDEAERMNRWSGTVLMLIERHAESKIVGVLADQPHHLTVVTKGIDGLQARFLFEFEPSNPNRIKGLGLEVGGPTEGPELPELGLADSKTSTEIDQELNRWFERLADDGVFSGTALVAVHGQPVYRGAWGLATLAWNIPNDIDTRFDLGSINKSFTQIAVAQMVLSGRLSLDDRIIDHLADYPNVNVAEQVTVRQLLQHTSGLGDIFTDEFFQSSKALYREPVDFFPLFAEQPLSFEPGQGQSYSNAGYMVLGAIIAAASGETYSHYVEQHIFRPARMTGAGFFAHDDPVPNVAIGYTRIGPLGKPEKLRNNLFHLPIKGNSAGSAYATVDDLLKFDNALRNHELLPPSYSDWCFGGPEPAEGETRYDKTERSTVSIGIAGGAPGVSADLEGNGELTVIVLSNFDAPIAETVGQTLFRALSDKISLY